MAEAIVGPLLSKLQEVVVAEATTLASVGDTIESLRDKLMWLHALLHEIDQRRHDCSRFRQVLAQQIREVASQAEDATDKFQLRADLSRRRWPRALVFVFNFYTQIRVRYTLSREVQSMNARLEEIIDNSSKYSTVYNGEGSSEKDKSWKQSASIRREWLWKNSPPFEWIIRNNEKKELKKKLMDQSGPVVIYVVGDSGMGKRTLLRSAYEDQEIRNHFDVCFSLSFQPSSSEAKVVFDVEKQLKTYESLHKRKSDADNICFLVWIKSPVSITQSGNEELEKLRNKDNRQAQIKIMVSVTSSYEWMKENSRIILKPLDKSESLALFQYTVNIWMNNITSTYIKDEIENVEKYVEDYTNGRPLAAVCLAKFMIAMDNYHKWEIAPDTMSSINDDKLKVIILLCIDDLPDELKLCLLYTAAFPENTTIDAKKLLRLWTAEGFLSPQHGMEAEQLGQSYLKELIHRGLLINMTSTQYDDDVHSVVIHDVLHQIFRSEGQRRSFMHVHCSGIVTAPDNTRRLALQNYCNAPVRLGDRCSKLRTVVYFSPLKKGDEKDIGEDITKSRGTDTEPSMQGCLASCQLTCYRATCSASMTAGSTSSSCGITLNQGTDLSWNEEPTSLDGGMLIPLLKGSPYLRVIHLEGSNIGTNLPDEIGDMVHLRYLGIRCPSLKRVPGSIGKLGRLQTLDVRDTQVRELPSSFWKIRTLIHVLGNGLLFPKRTTKGKMADILFPKREKGESANLDSLRTLETVTIDHMDRWIQRVRLLHRLHIMKLQKSHRDGLETLLKALNNLQSLSLSALSEDSIPLPFHWFTSRKQDVVASTYWGKSEMSLELEGKLQFPGVLETTDISGYYICLLNLTHLVLKSTQIGQSFIDVTAKLPVLARLELHMGSYKDTTVVFCAQGFTRLKEVWFSGLFGLKTIIGPDKNMERIVTLVDMGRVKFQTHKDCCFCESSNKEISEHCTSNLNPTSGQKQNSKQEFENLGVLHKIHQSILEAIKHSENDCATKTAIENYIKSNYGDPLVLLLDEMAKCNELETTIQRNHKIYITKPLDGAKVPTTVPEMIHSVIDEKGSTKTAITVNFRKRYPGKSILTLVLEHMASSDIHQIKKEGNAYKLLGPSDNSNSVNPGMEDHGASVPAELTT